MTEKNSSDGADSDCYGFGWCTGSGRLLLQNSQMATTGSYNSSWRKVLNPGRAPNCHAPQGHGMKYKALSRSDCVLDKAPTGQLGRQVDSAYLDNTKIRHYIGLAVLKWQAPLGPLTTGALQIYRILH